MAATSIEPKIVAALRDREASDLDDRALVETTLERVTVHRDKLTLALVDGDTIEVAWTAPARAAAEIVAGSTPSHRPMRAEARSVLLRQVALGRRWLAAIVEGSATAESIASRELWSVRQVERTIGLAFLAPEIVRAAAHAALPRGATTAMLADAPASWTGQRQLLGL